MAQKVQAIDNPNFSIAPLTTISGSIVSRRRVKVPVNFVGNYGPARGTKNFIAYFDIADNESFIDLTKMTLNFDITPSWVNADSGPLVSGVAAYPQKQGNILPPLFDQSLQSMFFRLTIGTSQGLKIEEILNYSSWGNIVQMHTMDAQRKEQHLLDMSDYSKSVGKEQGMCTYYDSILWKKGNGGIPHLWTERVSVRFEHSSFLNRVRFLPLFLFRNGIRFEIEMDDIHRTFTYSLAPRLLDMEKFPQYIRSHNATSGSSGSQYWGAQWFISAGTNLYGTNGTYGSINNNAIVANAGTLGSSTGTLPSAAQAGTPVVQVGIPANLYLPATPNQSTYAAGSIHTLNVNQQMWSKICSEFENTQSQTGYTSNSTALDGSKAYFMCFPIYIYENDQLVYKAFTAFNMLDFIPGIDIRYPVAGASGWYQNSNVLSSKYVSISTGAQLGSGVVNATTTTTAFVPYQTVVSWANVNAGTYPFTANTGSANVLTTITTKGFGTELFYQLPVYWYPKRQQAYYYKNVEITQATAPYAPNLITYLKNAKDLNATIFIDFKNKFIVPDNVSVPTASAYGITNFQDLAVDPYILEQVWPGYGGSANQNVIQWDYTLQNLEMLLDVVKPDSQTFMNFQNMYTSPSGIPYQYKRIIYRTVQQSTPATGTIQFTLPISVRSLSGLVIAMQDQWCTNPGVQADPDFTKYMMPLSSSFRRRGLYRAEVVVGGQTYPVYQLWMQPQGVPTQTTVAGQPTGIADFDMAHVLESENFFGVPGSTSFNPSFSTGQLDVTRNYLLCGTCGVGGKTLAGYGSNTLNGGQITQPAGTGYTTGTTTLSDLDASQFVLAFSLQKDDVMNFATGIDSSQSGSIVVNLYFQQVGTQYSDPAAWYNRPINFNMWAICDAVCTLQNEAVLVRY